jgi:hypothetical protein
LKSETINGQGEKVVEKREVELLDLTEFWAKWCLVVYHRFFHQRTTSVKKRIDAPQSSPIIRGELKLVSTIEWNRCASNFIMKDYQFPVPQKRWKVNRNVPFLAPSCFVFAVCLSHGCHKKPFVHLITLIHSRHSIPSIWSFDYI